MRQSVRRILHRLFLSRQPGQVIAAVLTAVSLLGLAALFVSKSADIHWFSLCSAGAYLGFIRWITFQRPVKPWLIPALFCLVWLIPLVRTLLGAGGGPVTWDEMLYMDLARTSAAEPRVLNQYFHIYLLKIFYWLAGSADFSAARYYWIAVQTTVLFLVYQSAVILTRRFSAFARILSGTAAVVLFASQPLVMEYLGVAYVDFTLGLLLTSAAFLLILADARPAFAPAALVLLGLLFGLGLKTKEVALILLIPTFGLVWMNRTAQQNWRSILKTAGLFAAGILAALVLLIILNTLVLVRPLWGFTPQDLQTWFIVRTGADPGLKPYYRQSYFTELSSTASLCSLALIALLLFRRDLPTRTGVYHTLLAVLAGFILIYTLIPFQAYDRYLIPVYPLLAILAGPAVAELTGGSIRRIMIILLACLPAALLVWFIQSVVYPGLDPAIYIGDYFYTSFVLPILFCGLVLALIVIPARLTDIKTAMMSLLMIAAVLYPLANVVHDLSRRQPERLVTERFKIIRLWNPDVHSYPDRQIFISEKINNPGGPLVISADYARIMLNLYFDANLPTGIVTSKVDQFLQDDFSGYCYGILPTREFDALPQSDQTKIEDAFTLSLNNNSLLTYLQNPACP